MTTDQTKTDARPAPVSFRPSPDVVSLLSSVRASSPNRSVREIFEEAFLHYHTAGPGALRTVADLSRRLETAVSRLDRLEASKV